ncbi:flagellar hook capping FlgD N-terminal domain-containing protein [Sphingomonas adhaesiva]|uniref:flagellar hook capping FlgD N-terminal domain-containing protein n=1 Tax=Sphingomonas adhaesiva TaxID=28212 RepID=UPI002FFC1D3D
MADAIAAVGAAETNTARAQASTSAFGLSFDSLLKIILTQLTYQDPLKPMENFEFVSQLAQFSQIQQGQAMSDSIAKLVAAQSVTQATGLLGRSVDVASGSSSLTGTVKGVSFQNGDPRITIETAAGQSIGDLPLSSVTQIREKK